MVELFCSWCKGLPYSKEALKLLVDSNEFSGIELSSISEEIDLILGSGLSISLHNPLRNYNESIESDSFIDSLSNEPLFSFYSKKVLLPFISFHAGRTCFYKKECYSKEKIISNTKKNLGYLNELIDKEILLEGMCFIKKMVDDKKTFPTNLYSTSKEFFEDFLSNTNANALIDVSHTLVSGQTRILNGLYDKKISDYFSDFLDSTKKRVFELHINSFELSKENSFVDAHFPFSNNFESELVFDCTRNAVNKCRNLKAITLEIESKMDPINHAKLMINQAKLVRKKLGLN